MEENGKSKNAADEMISSVKEYVALKIDELKLKGVEGLSLLCSKMIFIFLAAMTIVIVLQLLGLSLGFLIGEYLGSNALGFLAVGAFFIIVFIILYLFKNKIFVNNFVKFFIQIFFNGNSK